MIKPDPELFVPASERVDIVIAGGGLAGCLTALRLAAARPDLSLRLLEAGPAPGGNHTWSFFETDLGPDDSALIDHLIVHRWAGYDVRFPGYARTLGTGYRSITSDRLAAVVSKTLGSRLMCSAEVEVLDETSVTLAGGTRITAGCVIDARGPRAIPNLVLGFQKFIGHEVETTVPHGVKRPIIMDASVPQTDGYRFVYTLPFSPTRLLIEDTYYSGSGDLGIANIDERIAGYARDHGWTIARVVRTETGVLPIILAGAPNALAAGARNAPPRIGLAGAFFHPTTGYSLPDAVRLAGRLAATAPLTTATARTTIDAYAAEIWAGRTFLRFLNRMLFLAGRPDGRYAVLQHFYRLREPLIQRFYAAALTTADRARILIGTPPVPIHQALRCIPERAAYDSLRMKA
jgi:lycopene beta-cyclase